MRHFQSINTKNSTPLIFFIYNIHFIGLTIRHLRKAPKCASVYKRVPAIKRLWGNKCPHISTCLYTFRCMHIHANNVNVSVLKSFALYLSWCIIYAKVVVVASLVLVRQARKVSIQLFLTAVIWKCDFLCGNCSHRFYLK